MRASLQQYGLRPPHSALALAGCGGGDSEPVNQQLGVVVAGQPASPRSCSTNRRRCPSWRASRLNLTRTSRCSGPSAATAVRIFLMRNRALLQRREVDFNNTQFGTYLQDGCVSSRRRMPTTTGRSGSCSSSAT